MAVDRFARTTTHIIHPVISSCPDQAFTHSKTARYISATPLTRRISMLEENHTTHEGSGTHIDTASSIILCIEVNAENQFQGQNISLSGASFK